MPTPFPHQIYTDAVQRYTEEGQTELTCCVTQCDTVTVSPQFERFRDSIGALDISSSGSDAAIAGWSSQASSNSQ